MVRNSNLIHTKIMYASTDGHNSWDNPYEDILVPIDNIKINFKQNISNLTSLNGSTGETVCINSHDADILGIDNYNIYGNENVSNVILDFDIFDIYNKILPTTCSMICPRENLNAAECSLQNNTLLALDVAQPEYEIILVKNNNGPLYYVSLSSNDGVFTSWVNNFSVSTLLQ